MNAYEQRVANVRAIAAYRRAATHCKRNHELTPENVYVRPATGWRQCRICQADRMWYRRRGLPYV